MSRLMTPLLAGVALMAVGGIAAAQMASTYDPAQLPAITGKVTQYLPTPRGDVDGLLLDDGTQVHVPPHMSTQLVFAVHPGDTVTVHGLKARAVPMVAAASVTNDATHVTVVDNGPHGHDGQQIEAAGKVRMALHGPRGEVNGVLLDNGAVVHLPPHEANRLASQLAVGQTLLARGDGVEGPLGKSVGAREIGPDAEHLTKVAGPRPGWERMGHEHGGPMHHHPGKDGGPEDGPDAPPPPPPAQ